MCRWRTQSQYRGYFSLDAALAGAIVLFSFASYAILLSASAAGARTSADEVSGSLLSLRFSSYVMEQSSEGNGGHYEANRIDPGKLSGLELRGILQRTGKKYAKVRLVSEQGELLMISQGEPAPEIHCSKRLVLLGRETARLEVCLG